MPRLISPLRRLPHLSSLQRDGTGRRWSPRARPALVLWEPSSFPRKVARDVAAADAADDGSCSHRMPAMVFVADLSIATLASAHQTAKVNHVVQNPAAIRQLRKIKLGHNGRVFFMVFSTGDKTRNPVNPARFTGFLFLENKCFKTCGFAGFIQDLANQRSAGLFDCLVRSSFSSASPSSDRMLKARSNNVLGQRSLKHSSRICCRVIPRGSCCKAQ